jgi:hypothetical protein
MENDHGSDADDSTEGQQLQVPSSQTSRASPIVLTSGVNLIQLRRQLNGLLKGNFEYRSTRKGARVVMKEVAGLSTVCSHFASNDLSWSLYMLWYGSFHSQLLQRSSQMGCWTLALMLLASNNVYHRFITCRRNNHSNTSLFLMALPKMSNSHEILKLTSLCHIAVKVEAYITQTGLTYCYKCQKCDYVWANCK